MNLILRLTWCAQDEDNESVHPGKSFKTVINHCQTGCLLNQLKYLCWPFMGSWWESSKMLIK